jgi:hypothetical protein
MTGEQAAMLKRLAQVAYELDAFKPSLMRVEADVRIATALAGEAGFIRIFSVTAAIYASPTSAVVSAEKESFTRGYGSLPPMKCPWRNARSRDKQ